MYEIMKLFKSVLVKQKNVTGSPYIRKGILYTPDVGNEYKDIDSIINMAEKIFLLSAKQINSSFHKSWQKIRDVNIEQLVLEQIIHYITTYGFESLNIYNSESVYIPREKLELPEIDIDKIELIVIKGITKEELKEKLMKMMCSGIALDENTIKDIVNIITDNDIGFDNEDVRNIKNKEIKSIIMDKLSLVPDDPVEYLRYIIYKMTGETLLIKNKELIEKIKENQKIFSLLKIDEHSQRKLASIFYRFKPLFLAMKGTPTTNKIINRIRKLAKKYHRPMKQDYLNNITNQKYIDILFFKKELNKVNIFRKIRLANAIKYRMLNSGSIVYRIRNGKSYSTENKKRDKDYYDNIYEIIEKSIKDDIKEIIGNKKIYIPDYIKYTLPSSEKQFSDNVPLGTNITVKENMVFGVYWKNVDKNRIDLDLSLLSVDSKFGWDARYRNEERSILFSGDMTDACDGASELYYIEKNKPGIYLVMLNYYNYNKYEEKDIPVPFRIFIADEKINLIEKNYMVNPENILININTEIKRKQKLLGLVKIDENKSIFYFCETNIGMSITSSDNEYMKHCRNYLKDFYSNLMNLNDMIGDVTKKNECDIDLSPKNLTKDKLLDIIIKT